MQEKECYSVTQTTLHWELNINSKRNKWKLMFAMFMGKEHVSFQYIEKDLLFTLNFEKQHKRKLVQN